MKWDEVFGLASITPTDLAPSSTQVRLRIFGKEWRPNAMQTFVFDTDQ